MNHAAFNNKIAHAFGEPACRGVIRSQFEDFLVEEIDGFAATGSGEHYLLTIEKRDMTTAFVAQQLAQWAGVKEISIGYAGLKDRHAVTRQRFSVHLPKRVAPAIVDLQSSELRVLNDVWHAKKIPRGALAGNRFELVVREIDGDISEVEKRLDQVATHGVPNYFGEQRFGRNGDNIPQALAMFAGRRVRREQRTMLISAARSELFNRVLSARVSDASWNQALQGEIWVLDGSRSVFGPEPFDTKLSQRLQEFDIHPSGPLWGCGPLKTCDRALELEQAVLNSEDALALRAGLEAAGLKQERRALRLRPANFEWLWVNRNTLKLAFELPPGTYATTVLAELGEFNHPGRYEHASVEKMQ